MFWKVLGVPHDHSPRDDYVSLERVERMPYVMQCYAIVGAHEFKFKVTLITNSLHTKFVLSLNIIKVRNFC